MSSNQLDKSIAARTPVLSLTSQKCDEVGKILREQFKINTAKRSKTFSVEVEWRFGSTTEGGAFNTDIGQEVWKNIKQILDSDTERFKAHDISYETSTVYNNYRDKLLSYRDISVTDSRGNVQEDRRETKKRVAISDFKFMKNLDVRLAFSNEINLLNSRPNLEEYTSKAFVRIKERYSYDFISLLGGKSRFDLTVVSRPEEEYKSYELEVEFTGFPDDLQKLFEPLKFVLHAVYPNFLSFVEQGKKEDLKGFADEFNLRFANPINLLRINIEAIKEDGKYAISPKLDGTRYNLFVKNDHVFISNGNDYLIQQVSTGISRPYGFQNKSQSGRNIFNNKSKLTKQEIFLNFLSKYEGTVLEGEMHDNIFYIYDCRYYQKRSLDSISYRDRLSAARDFRDEVYDEEFDVASFLLPGFSIAMKDVLFPKNDMNAAIAGMFNLMEDKAGDGIQHDGIIFTPTGRYPGKQEHIFKWKFPELLSIDFSIVKLQDNKYKLDVGSKANNVEILASFKDQVMTVTEHSFIGRLKDGLIVECIGVNRGSVSNPSVEWIPHKIRSDKLKPNYISTANSVYEDIVNPISKEELENGAQYNVPTFADETTNALVVPLTSYINSNREVPTSAVIVPVTFSSNSIVPSSSISSNIMTHIMQPNTIANLSASLSRLNVSKQLSPRSKLALQSLKSGFGGNPDLISHLNNSSSKDESSFSNAIFSQGASQGSIFSELSSNNSASNPPKTPTYSQYASNSTSHVRPVSLSDISAAFSDPGEDTYMTRPISKPVSLSEIQSQLSNVKSSMTKNSSKILSELSALVSEQVPSYRPTTYQTSGGLSQQYPPYLPESFRKGDGSTSYSSNLSSSIPIISKNRGASESAYTGKLSSRTSILNSFADSAPLLISVPSSQISTLPQSTAVVVTPSENMLIAPSNSLRVREESEREQEALEESQQEDDEEQSEEEAERSEPKYSSAPKSSKLRPSENISNLNKISKLFSGMFAVSKKPTSKISYTTTSRLSNVSKPSGSLSVLASSAENDPSRVALSEYDSLSSESIRSNSSASFSAVSDVSENSVVSGIPEISASLISIPHHAPSPFGEPVGSIDHRLVITSSAQPTSEDQLLLMSNSQAQVDDAKSLNNASGIVSRLTAKQNEFLSQQKSTQSLSQSLGQSEDSSDYAIIQEQIISKSSRSHPSRSTSYSKNNILRLPVNSSSISVEPLSQIDELFSQGNTSSRLNIREQDKLYRESQRNKSSVLKSKSITERLTINGKLSSLGPLRKSNNAHKASLIKEYVNKDSVVLDLGFGRGGDIHKYEIADVKHIWAVEPNKFNSDEAEKRIKEKPSGFQDRVNILNYSATDSSNIKNRMTRQDNDGIKKANVVSMFFSMTFFFENEAYFNNLMRTIDENTTNDAIIIGTTMDGEYIQNFIGKDETKREKEGEYIFQKLYSPHNDETHRFGKKIMVNFDGTIVKNQHEYLVFSDIMRQKFAEIGFEEFSYYTFNPIINRQEANDVNLRELTPLHTAFGFRRKTSSPISINERKEFENYEISALERPRDTVRIEEDYGGSPVPVAHLANFKPFPGNFIQDPNLFVQNVVGDGSCFFHCVYAATDPMYGDLGTSNDRTEYVKNQRIMLSEKLTFNEWKSLNNGHLAITLFLLYLPVFIECGDVTPVKDTDSLNLYQYNSLTRVIEEIVKNDENTDHGFTRNLLDSAVAVIYGEYKDALADHKTYVGLSNDANDDERTKQVDAIEYVKNKMNLNIYFVDRIGFPIPFFTPTLAERGRKSMVIYVNDSINHYELVYKRKYDGSRDYLFDNSDPVIQRINAIIKNTTKEERERYNTLSSRNGGRRQESEEEKFEAFEKAKREKMGVNSQRTILGDSINLSEISSFEEAKRVKMSINSERIQSFPRKNVVESDEEENKEDAENDFDYELPPENEDSYEDEDENVEHDDYDN